MADTKQIIDINVVLTNTANKVNKLIINEQNKIEQSKEEILRLEGRYAMIEEMLTYFKTKKLKVVEDCCEDDSNKVTDNEVAEENSANDTNQ